MVQRKHLGVALSLLLVSASARAGDPTFTLHPDPGVQSPTTLNLNWTEADQEIGDNDGRLDLLCDPDSCATGLAAGTLVGGAAIQTGTDDDVPDAGDFGAATDLDANGAIDSTPTIVIPKHVGLTSPDGTEDESGGMCFEISYSVASTLERVWCKADGGGTIPLTMNVCDANGTSNCTLLEGPITCGAASAERGDQASDPIDAETVAAERTLCFVLGDPTPPVTSFEATAYMRRQLITP
jgi:hypothetical protein